MILSLVYNFIMNKLKNLRDNIDEVDSKVFSLFKKRLELVEQIGLIKQMENLPLSDNNREAEILANLAATVDEHDYSTIAEIYATVFSTSKQRQLITHKFFNRSVILEKMNDPVFAVAKQAINDKSPNVVNATIGVLCDDQDQIVAFKSVYQVFNNLVSDKQKAAYAQSFIGNDDYIKAVEKWVLPLSIAKYRKVIATSGGTGAISIAIKNTLNFGEYIFIPSIAWTSYQLMAQECGLQTATYQMFDDAGEFSLDSLISTIFEISVKQRKIVLVINDPAQNPTGYSMTYHQWEKIISILNQLDNEIILINDIAYADYCNDLSASNRYLDIFNTLDDHILTIIAFSCSKTLTMYGMRLGAAIILGDCDVVNQMMIVFERETRAFWSNINNGAMHTFVKLLDNDLLGYMAEKRSYIDLLKQRSTIFLQEAKSCQLKCYPYVEGFFITIICQSNELRDNLFSALVQHHIYTVIVDKGIRIAICSVSTAKITGLATRIMEVKSQLC